MRLVISSKLISQFTGGQIPVILHGPSDRLTFKFCHQVTGTITIEPLCRWFSEMIPTEKSCFEGLYVLSEAVKTWYVAEN
jgi:hypothetical protein